MKHRNTLPVIGVLISDIESSYQERFFDELRRQSDLLGIKPVIYSGTVVGTPTWFERQMNMAYHLADGRHLDGVLSVTATFMRDQTESIVHKFLGKFAPLPRVSVTAALNDIPSVLIDNAGGFRAMLEHLVHVHAYRDFAFLSGPAGSYDAQQRLKVFRSVMVENAIRVDPRLIQDGEFYYYSARAAAERILSSGLPVRVIVAANDEMAMAAIAVASTRGIRVPEELAVVGVDNLHTHVAGLGLTTVNTALDKQLSTGLRCLLDQMAGLAVPPLSFVPSQPVFRQSCGCMLEPGQPLGRDLGWAERESAVLDGLALSAADRPRFERYMQLCLDALSSEAPRALERAVADIARECFGLGDSVMVLQSLLLGIQTHLIDPDVLSPHDHWRIGLQFSHAQVSLLKAKTMHAVVLGERIGITGGSINHLKRQLLSFEIHQQMANLPALLGQFGIKTCIIAFYEDQGYFNTSNDYLLPAKAQLVACLIDGKRHNDQLWRPFDTAVLLPEEVWTLTGKQALIVAPAFQQAGHYGYIVFGPERPIGISLESVREAIASALIGSLLVEEIGRVRDYLDKTQHPLARTSRSIEQISSHDPLSGLLNRQGFIEEATLRLKRSDLNRHLLIHAWIQGLEAVEAELGQFEVALAINESARVFASMLRATDLVGRAEPNHFVALCSDADARFVSELEKRLIKAFESFNLQSNLLYKIHCALRFEAVQPDSSLALMVSSADPGA